MRGIQLIASALALAAIVFVAGSCEEGKRDDRKEFRILENQLRMRLEHFMAFHKGYPEDLRELEDAESYGYKLPRLPEGYHFDYNPSKGTVRILPDE